MSRRAKIVAVLASVLVLVAVATGVGVAAIGDDDEPLSGDPLERATAAALTATGGGEVVATEVGDDAGSAYEVEVRMPDGSQVEVQLDADFAVIATDADDDGPGNDDGPGDDEGDGAGSG